MYPVYVWRPYYDRSFGLCMRKPCIFLVTTPPPKKRLPNCALNLFFGRDSELQIYRVNKHRKLFVIKHSKGCKFMPIKLTKCD